jgi:hypothetical protein
LIIDYSPAILNTIFAGSYADEAIFYYILLSKKGLAALIHPVEPGLFFANKRFFFAEKRFDPRYCKKNKRK